MFDIRARIKLEGCCRPRRFVNLGTVFLGVSGGIKENAIRDFGTVFVVGGSGIITPNGFDYSLIDFGQVGDEQGSVFVGGGSGIITPNGFDYSNLDFGQVGDEQGTVSVSLGTGNIVANGFDFSNVDFGNVDGGAGEAGEVYVAYSGNIQVNGL